MVHRRNYNRKRGFTLIELLVVILILAVLAAMIVPRLVGRGEDAKVASTQSQLATYGRMLETFRLDVGRYPTTEEGLGALWEQPSDAEGWKGPYVNKAIEPDSWGNEYVYESPGAQGDDSYLLFSYGSDGVEGGEGNAEDLIESGA